ncbi:MAG: hypothetical protein OER88_06220, partial [Planctomycetota bacterium]|nr:hypothetical protein [Planctomycetota bacterium]
MRGVLVLAILAVAVRAAPEAVLLVEHELTAERWVPAIRFDPQHRWLAVARRRSQSAQKFIEDVWIVSLETGKRLWRKSGLRAGMRLGRFVRDEYWWVENGALRALAPRTGKIRVIPVRAGEAIAGVSADGKYIAFASGRRFERLRVVRLPDGKAVLDVEDFRQPQKGPHGLDVTFHRHTVLYHSRPADKTGGGDYRLRAYDLDQGRAIGAWPAWVSHHTLSRAVAGDRVLYHGGSDYEILRTDLEGGGSRPLFNCREQLYSHWLEVSLFGRLLVTWSSARRVLVCFDTETNRRFDVEGTGGNLLAVFGKAAWLADDDGVYSLDLETRAKARHIGEKSAIWAAATDGRTMVARAQKDG